MIKLLELLNIKEEQYSLYKVHFAYFSGNKNEVKDIFYNGTFKQYQEEQANQNFKRKYIISLVGLENNKWLFAGVYEVIGNPQKHVFKDGNEGFKYETIEVDTYKTYGGRVIINYKKEYRASYPNLELVPTNGQAFKDVEVSQILEERLSIDDFRGFDVLNISYQTLKNIILKNISSYKNVLSKVKGVYLISDHKSGMLYVGSAYGDDCIWSRWEDYSKNGHGGNVQLKELIKSNGMEYATNFTYSILEVCNMNIGNEHIIERETHWKNILMTREFGLNLN